MRQKEIIQTTINEWMEHLEMNPGSEWQIIAQIIACKLEKQIDDMRECKRELEYYKRVANVSQSTRI